MSNLKSENIKTLNKIFNADTILISINSGGCFHDYKTNIIIKKSGKKFELLYSGGRNGIEIKKHVSKNKLQKLKRIFKKGFKINTRMCTSIDRFIANGNGQSVHFDDGRCRDKFDLLDKLNRKLGVSNN